MKKIIIVCAGIYGREVLSVIDAINYQASKNGEERPYELLGFIDDNLNALNDTDIDIPILGTIQDWKPKDNEVYAIGASSPETKYRLASLLKKRGCCFETLIAPWSVVSPDCTMGEGCFITAYGICSGVTLGDFVNINGSLICPGAIIGDFSTTTGFSVIEDAVIGKRVFVGSHVVIPSGVHVGDNSKVSVGSIVREDVKAQTTVFGVPASEI